MYPRLIDTMEERGITKNKLAQISCIAQPDVYCLVNGKKPAFPSWRERISNALGIKEEYLFATETEYVEDELFCEYVYYDNAIWYVDDYDEAHISLWQAAIQNNHLTPTPNIVTIPISKCRELKVIDLETIEEER